MAYICSVQPPNRLPSLSSWSRPAFYDWVLVDSALVGSVLVGLFLAGLFLAGPVLAAPLALVQYPAGSSVAEPAPNVIVSVDDSGSMGDSGIQALQDALRSTFAEDHLPDHKVRLAWQSMNRCPGIPGPDRNRAKNCGGDNQMRSLDSRHRENFLKFVDGLEAHGGTPAHQMLRNAGDYLKETDLGIHSPWAEEPGQRQGELLGCRKSFHIFMTDGSWNSSATAPRLHRDADRSLRDYRTLTMDNLDSVRTRLPDGQTFDPNSAETRIYTDDWGGDTLRCTRTRRGVCTQEQPANDPINTLSDLAFHYWATDLQPGIPNQIRPIIKHPGEEILSQGGRQLRLNEYWNPKNNPATWQSLTTYTIGFADATNWSTGPSNPTPLLDWRGDTYAGSYTALALGLTQWPSPLCNRSGAPDRQGRYACDGASSYAAHNNTGHRRTELWHMALNARGRFIPAQSADDLKTAFTDIIDTIVADSANPITSLTSASNSISQQGTTAYLSGYESLGWTGSLSAQEVGQGSAALQASSGWGNGRRAQTSADKLDALPNAAIADRVILSHNGAQGVNFVYADLSQLQQDWLSRRQFGSASLDALGPQRLDFIRGDRREEGRLFRQRLSRQGDIVNSALWYTPAPRRSWQLPGYREFAEAHRQRQPMLYVGGNDGMLHGFSADDGVERLAYVPQGVLPYLPNLALPDYSHRYYVDGSAFTGEVNVGSAQQPDWRTLLVGSLGAGGPGFFVLDVSRPTSDWRPQNAARLVLQDRTDGADPDIGHIFAQPVTHDYNPQIATQISRLNDGRWAVLLGNGYNSRNEAPVLLIQYLDGAQELRKLPAASRGPEASGNGLSAPRLVDIDGDGLTDLVYAGDLRGNLWKFDLTSADPSRWGLAFQGQPLYTAVHTQGATSQRQPITTAPLVRSHGQLSGLMVAFGTGRELTEADRQDHSVQSFYALHDRSLYRRRLEDGAGLELSPTSVASALGSGLAQLVERRFQNRAIAGQDGSQGLTFWNMGEQPSLDAQHRGWYLHFPIPGERLLRHPGFYSPGSRIIDLRSDLPASGGQIDGASCTPSANPAQAWRSLLGLDAGLRPSLQLLDANGDGLYTAIADQQVNRVTTATSSLQLFTRHGQAQIDGRGQVAHSNALSAQPQVINWYQMQ